MLHVNVMQILAYATDEVRMTENWDGSVGIVTGYGMDVRGVGVRVPVGSRIVTSPC
jgi:hypothetical protein